MQLVIDITPEQEAFLTQFAERQCPGAPDNLGTHKPLHLVQTCEHATVFDGGGSGDLKYFSADTQEVYEDAADLVKAVRRIDDVLSYDDAEYEEINDIFITNVDEYFKAYGVDACAVSRVRNYRTVAYFFTLNEARRYIKYQAHNLNEPRTYTVSPGYSNKGDYEPFWDLLMSIGKQLINPPSENKTLEE